MNDENRLQIEDPKFHLLDVNRHNLPDDAWIIIEDKVYDITDFTTHPGSHEILLRNAGTDRTAQFHAVSHPQPAFEQMKQFYVGDLGETADDVSRQSLLSKIVIGITAALTLHIIIRRRG